MFTIEAQLGIFILLMVYFVLMTIKSEKFDKLTVEWITAWPSASLVILAIIDIIAAAIYLIAGWWQL